MIGRASGTGPPKRNMRSANVLRGSAGGDRASTMVFVSGNIYIKTSGWTYLEVQHLPRLELPVRLYFANILSIF